MIARNHVLANLRRLERLYLAAASQSDAQFYAKLALLELCGWIEESMDDIVLRCAARCIKDPKNRKHVIESIVGGTFGFDYSKHFRKMVMRLVGLANLEQLERRLDATKQAKLASALSALTTARNSAAHTHLRGTTRQINAPSLTLSHFQDVYEGLVEYDVKIRKFIY